MDIMLENGVELMQLLDGCIVRWWLMVLDVVGWRWIAVGAK